MVPPAAPLLPAMSRAGLSVGLAADGRAGGGARCARVRTAPTAAGVLLSFRWG